MIFEMESTHPIMMIRTKCDVHIANDNWPPRSFVLSVRARIAQGQREETAGRVEALARRTERRQPEPSLRLSATGQSVTLRQYVSKPTSDGIRQRLHCAKTQHLSALSIFTKS